MKTEWPEDSKLFDCSGMDSLLLAIEFLHAFNPVKHYLIGLHQEGALEGKTYGEIRRILSGIFGEPAKEILFKSDYN